MLFLSSLFQKVVQLPVVPGIQGRHHQLDEKHHQSGRPQREKKGQAGAEIQEVKIINLTTFHFSQ